MQIRAGSLGELLARRLKPRTLEHKLQEPSLPMMQAVVSENSRRRASAELACFRIACHRRICNTSGSMRHASGSPISSTARLTRFPGEDAEQKARTWGKWHVDLQKDWRAKLCWSQQGCHMYQRLSEAARAKKVVFATSKTVAGARTKSASCSTCSRPQARCRSSA